MEGNQLQGSADTVTKRIRRTATTYSDTGTTQHSAGYFPFTITQYTDATNGHQTRTNTDPKTGLPTYVQDIAGVVSTTTYDNLARPTRLTSTGVPEQHIRYRSTSGDNQAPSRGIMSIQTFQSGAPQTREYKDVLGRTLRAASEGFNGTWVYQDNQYNARGLMTHESQPYYADQTPAWTAYSNFDVLGRVQSKVTPQTNGSLTTTYSYNGLITDISVAASNSDVGNLSLSRTYNVLEQLVETQDANSGTTRYAYDGAGNPIVIEDANRNRITAQYDALGRKNYVNDPNQGRTDFTYNDFGELEKETDANNDIIRYDMDLLGRVTSRIATTSGTTSIDRIASNGSHLKNSRLSSSRLLSSFPYTSCSICFGSRTRAL